LSEIEAFYDKNASIVFYGIIYITGICRLERAKGGSEMSNKSDQHQQGQDRTMATGDFQSLQRSVFALHQQGKFREALEVALLATEKFPDRSVDTSYWLACLYSRLGELDMALRALEAAMEHGLWWSEQVLLNDLDLQPLHDCEGFKAILAECRRLKRAAQAEAKPKLLVFTPEDYTPRQARPLLIALHWRGSSAQDFAPYWKTALSLGFIIGVPQSSQLFAKDKFCWDDDEQAEREVAEAYSQLRNSYAVDPDQVILAGASQGGALAIMLALKGAIPCRGFIAVIPAFREVEAFIPWAGEAASRGLRGWMLTGENDVRLPKVERLQAELVRKGLVCELVVEMGLGHDFPSDFGAKLPSAVSFILNGEWRE